MYLTRRAVTIRFAFRRIWGQCSFPPTPSELTSQQGLKGAFMRLAAQRLSIGPDKSYGGYPAGLVLDQIVDSLEMTALEEKLAAIRNLEFPKTLTRLEQLLGSTGSLRLNVKEFAMIIDPNQQRKTDLLRVARIDGKKPSTQGMRERMGTAKEIHTQVKDIKTNLPREKSSSTLVLLSITRAW